MLDTHFPRVEGDIGNPSSFSTQVIYQTIKRASVGNVVCDQAISTELFNAFLEGALKLEQCGAKVIGTSCGFLATTQERLCDALSVPIITSSLVLIPFLQSLFGKSATIGVLTFDDTALNETHFNGYLDDNIIIQGLPKSGVLFNVIRADQSNPVSIRGASHDALTATEALLAQSHKLGADIDAIVIECTNISPYKKAIADRSCLPVFDLVDALQWVVNSYQT